MATREAARRAQEVSKRGRVRKEPERLEAGPASIEWSSTTDPAEMTAAAATRKRSKKVPATPRKCTSPEGYRARQIAASELNDKQMELLSLYTKMFPIQAAEDPDFMIDTVSASTSFVIRHGKTREVVAGISFKTFENQRMASGRVHHHDRAAGWPRHGARTCRTATCKTGHRHLKVSVALFCRLCWMSCTITCSR